MAKKTTARDTRRAKREEWGALTNRLEVLRQEVKEEKEVLEVERRNLMALMSQASVFMDFNLNHIHNADIRLNESATFMPRRNTYIDVRLPATSYSQAIERDLFYQMPLDELRAALDSIASLITKTILDRIMEEATKVQEREAFAKGVM